MKERRKLATIVSSAMAVSTQLSSSMMRERERDRERDEDVVAKKKGLRESLC